MVTNVFLPSLDDVTADNAGPLVARDAPSAQAAIHQGNDFDESNYTSVAVLLLETKDRKLGEQDHQYYNEVVRRLLDDTKHVASVQDLWGKPVTMSGSQSADAEATTLTIRPVGDLGSSEANKSIDAIRDVVAKVPKPDGLSAYITGPAPLAADTLHATDTSLVKLTIVTVILIVILLLIAYRSITIALIPLFGVLTTLAVARGIISFLVGQGVIEISSFASNLLVSLVLGASTDYAIFYLGRYQEARQKGEDKESSYYESVANVPHVILGSGIAISGATLCLSLTHLDYFRTLGPPCAVSMVVAVLSALTLGPALLTIGSKIGWIQPRKKRANPVWRKVGTVIARWPVPMIALAALIIPLCMLGLDDLQGELQRPGFRTGKRRGEHRLRRRRQALPEELAQQRHRVREVGSRYAQYHRHDLVGPHRQGHHPHAGGRTGAKRHQAQRSTAGTRLAALRVRLHGDENRREHQRSCATASPISTPSPPRRPASSTRPSDWRI